MEAEPVTPLTPRPVGRPVFTQTWAELTFLHWALEPERVVPYLPPGVRPDTLDGRTYVGLVPFRMRDVGVLGSPGLPYLGTFLETNVRLYSVDATGRRGVVFVSLDAERLLPVLAARFGARLPYVWSSMRCARRGNRITYTSHRRPPSKKPVSSTITVTVGEPITPDERERWLTARWGLHQAGRDNRAGWYWPNAHETWPLHRAALNAIDDHLLEAAGFADLATRTPDSVLYSPGVHATFGPRLRCSGPPPPS